MTLVIAHRGASAERPENSLAAFALALDQGADGIELDVHATADGAIVVFHDARVPAGAIAELALDEVRRHRLSNDEPVPTLAEALALIGPDADAFIEVKGLPPAADASLLETIDGAPAPARCQVHAFDHRVVRRLTDLRPALGTGVLSASYPLHPAEQVRAAGAQALWQREELIDVPLVAQVHDAGFAVHAWTVDRADRMRRLREWGVDGICTNRPGRAREVIG